jgi:hypothetical protein
LLQSLRGAELAADDLRVFSGLIEVLQREPDRWRLFAFLEVVMSLSYFGMPLEMIGVDLATVLGLAEQLNGFVSDYHRTLFLHFMAQHNAQAHPMFEATRRGITALEEWAAVSTHEAFDEIVSFLPEIPGLSLRETE